MIPVVRKALIGWWVQGRWCPTRAIRDREVRRCNQVQVVRVEPGDVVVYTHHTDEFDRDAVRNASDVMGECFPDNRVVAIAKGATVTVARKTWRCASCNEDVPATTDPEEHARDCGGDRL